MTKQIRCISIHSYSTRNPDGHIVMNIQRGAWGSENSAVIGSLYRLRPGKSIERATWMMLRHQQREMERAGRQENKS